MGREVAPDALAGTVDDVQGLVPGTRVRRRQGEDLCAVLHVGHRHAGQRADDQMMPRELLAQGGQVAVIASPYEAGPEHGEVPAVLLDEALHSSRQRIQGYRAGAKGLANRS